MSNDPSPDLVPSHDAIDTIIRVQSATCCVDMGSKPGLGIQGVSHGMCDPCYDLAICDLNAWAPTAPPDSRQPTTKD